MLSNQQKRDNEECDRMMESGEGDKDCSECSCSVCIAQVDTGYDTKTINDFFGEVMERAEYLQEEYSIVKDSSKEERASLSDVMSFFVNQVADGIKAIKGE